MKRLYIANDINGFETIENFPEWAGYYITYGEDNSLSEEEISMIDDWMKSEGISEIYLADDSEGVFSSHPAFGLACDVVPVNVRRTASVDRSIVNPDVIPVIGSSEDDQPITDAELDTLFSKFMDVYSDLAFDEFDDRSGEYKKFTKELTAIFRKTADTLMESSKSGKPFEWEALSIIRVWFYSWYDGGDFWNAPEGGSAMEEYQFLYDKKVTHIRQNEEGLWVCDDYDPEPYQLNEIKNRHDAVLDYMYAYFLEDIKVVADESDIDYE